MEFKDVLTHLRRERGLSQEDVASRLFVTRQAISRWENGETTPNIDSLQALSRLFDVSINTLLGTPRQLVCQCCGMPLTDDIMARESDGGINQDYCRWCRADGQFVYQSLDELVGFLVNQHFIPGVSDEQADAIYREQLSRLKYWQDVATQ